MDEEEASKHGGEEQKHLFLAVDLATEQVFRKSFNSNSSLNIFYLILSQNLPGLASSPSAQSQPLPQPVHILCSDIIQTAAASYLGQCPDVLDLPAVRPEDMDSHVGVKGGFAICFSFSFLRVCDTPELKGDSWSSQLPNFRRAAVARCERRCQILSSCAGFQSLCRDLQQMMPWRRMIKWPVTPGLHK